MNKFNSFIGYFVSKETKVENDVESTTYTMTREGKAIGGFVFDTFSVFMIALFAIYFVGIAAQVAAVILGGLIMVTYFKDSYDNLRVLLSSFKKQSADIAEVEPSVDDAATA
jgi:hypothetical protein